MHSPISCRDGGSETNVPRIQKQSLDQEQPKDQARPFTPRAERAARRPLSKREAAYAAEVDKLLEAGLEVMRQTGTSSSPRVADIVEAAGLSNQAFYRHFSGKEDLIAAIVESGMYRLVSYLSHLMERESSADRKLRAWVTGVMSQASNPEVADATRAVVWNGRQLPGTPALAMEGMREPVAALLVEPLRSVDRTDPERDAEVIAEAVFGRMTAFLWAGRAPTDTDVDHLVSFCVAGVDLR